MLHSIISLTTELKAVHFNLVIFICIWVSCMYVPPVCARRWDEWGTLCFLSREFVPRFAGCVRARPAGGAPSAGSRHGASGSGALPALRRPETRAASPALRARQALTRGSWGGFWCCSCNWDIACRFAISAPSSVYITHSASSLADWGVNDSGLFVC